MFISDLAKKHNSLVSRALLFFALIIFSLDAYFKGNRGRDAVAYREHFDLLADYGGWFPNQGPYDFELGYVYFAFILGKMDFSYDFVPFLASVLTFLFVLFCSRTFNVSKIKLLTLLVLSGFLFFSYNGVRQWLSLMFIYSAAGFWVFQHKKIKSFLSAGIGLFFHKSGVVFIALFSFSRLFARIKREERFLILFPGAVVMAVFGYFVAGFLVEILGYTNYFSTIRLFVYNDLGFGWLIQVFLNLIFVSLVILKKPKPNTIEILASVWVVLYFVAPLDAVVMRLAVYFEFAQILYFSRLEFSRNLFNAFTFSVVCSLFLLKFMSLILFNAHGAILG